MVPLGLSVLFFKHDKSVFYDLQYACTGTRATVWNMRIHVQY